MKRSVLKFLGAALVTGLSALTVSAATSVNFAGLPLGFEAGRNPADGTLEFVARGGGSRFTVLSDRADISLLKKNGDTAAVQMEFIGANPNASLSAEAPSAGKINYLIGNDPSQWRRDVPAYNRVRCDNLYLGVNLVYYGNQSQLECDFDLAAGVNPGSIAFRFHGANRISINPQGELVINVNGGKIVEHKPEIYQDVGGWRHEISGGYKILSGNIVTFSVGPHDPTLPLVIDPVLGYLTYFGGTLGDFPWAAKLDGSNNLYIAGWTFSTLLYSNGTPFASSNAYQTVYQHGNFLGDGFVAKFDSLGSNVWRTYLGGPNGDNEITSLALDSSDNVYLTGLTTSTGFPVYPSSGVSGLKNSTHISGSYDPYLTTYPSDAFVTELDGAGTNVIFSTYLGGSEQDAGYGITVDSAGDVFVDGITFSKDFPTENALFSQLLCSNTTYFNNNAFVTEIAPGGAGLNFSTYWGGTNVDGATAIASTNGYIFVAGYTASTNFFTTNVVGNQVWATSYVTNQSVITTNHYYFTSTNLNGSTNLYNYPYDAFVTCFTNTGASLRPLYSTYLGGTNNDFATAITADGNGTAYVVGSTTSTNFPFYTGNPAITPNLDSYVRTNGLGGIAATNSFLTQIKWNGTQASLGYSVMFGALGVDIATCVTEAPDGKVFVGGYATSTNFPVTPKNLYGYLSPTNNNWNQGYADAFVMAFASNEPTMLYSAYLGGMYNDYAYAINVDSSDTAYVVGQTHSPNFPTFDAPQSFLNGTNDIFLAKIYFAPPSPTLITASSKTNLTVSWSPIGQETASTFALQSTTNLASTNWTTLTGVLETNGVFLYQTAPTNPAEFFRLDNF